MKKNVVASIVLGVLLLIAVVQGLQLSDIKGQLGDGVVGLSTSNDISSSPSKPISSGKSSIPKSIQNLPSMVGGC